MITKKLLLFLPKNKISKPIVYHIVKDYNLIFHIFRARITPEEEGHMVIEITGDENNIDKAITFLLEQGVKVNEKSEGMLWDSSKCSGCGSCVPHCPTKALHVSDNQTMEIVFSNEKCIECLNCIQVCPFGACSSIF